MRKKKQQEKVQNAKEFKFEGGPKDGVSMRLVNPPPSKIRFAIPEWSTYEWNEEKSLFTYIGNQPIPDSNPF